MFVRLCIVFLILHFTRVTPWEYQPRPQPMTHFQVDDVQEDPEVTFDTEDFIKHLGYPCETHVVTTEDGYVLKMFRIPFGKVQGRRCAVPRPPVLLQHGLLCSSDDWVVNHENQSLAYILADAQFDVWISNLRGNKYAQDHTRPEPSHHQFYQFSWDEMAEYDLPAIIDYILAATGYADLQYVGHSMGTTVAFAMLASKPDYNAKVRHFHAMAPVVFLNHSKSPVRYFAPFTKEIEVIFGLIGYDEFLPSDTLTRIISILCETRVRKYCENSLFFISGYDPQELNITRLPVYMSHTPAGTSSMTVVQYAQEIDSGFFQRYDYGILKNFDKYGQKTPPKYDLEQVVTNVTLYWGQRDLLADPQDVDNLRRALPNCDESRKIGSPDFAHVDFLWGIDCKALIYDYLISKLDRY